MAVLTDLPYEIMVEFLSLLSCADLSSTIRVSRRFHDVSQPLLYTGPCLTKKQHTTPRVSGTIGIFLQTLLTPGREALGSYVRSLRLELDDTEPVFEYPDDTVVRITAIARKLGINNPLSTQGPQLMIILDLLPRLHTLHISPPTARFFEPATALPRGLQSLIEIHYIGTATTDFVKPKRILAPLQLPSIRRIHVPSISQYNLPADALTAATGTSRITHLCFSRAVVSPSVLRFVLRVPIALTHFSYTAASRCSFSLPRFMRALAPLRASLVHLHLDFCGTSLARSDGGDVFRLPYADGSLREWAVLQTLRCSLVPLLGRMRFVASPRLVDVLPPGLKQLQVLPDWKWGVQDVVQEVGEVLARKKELVPCLEKVAVVMECGGTRRAVDTVMAACDAAGVGFVEESFCWM